MLPINFNEAKSLIRKNAQSLRQFATFFFSFWFAHFYHPQTNQQISVRNVLKIIVFFFCFVEKFIGMNVNVINIIG